MAIDHFRVKEFGDTNSKVVFFFAGMGTRTWMYKKPIKRMVDSGFRVIAYDFNPLIVRKGDPATYIRLADRTLTSVKHKAKSLKEEGITNFSAFGFSMGTLPAIKCTADIPDIDKVVIMLTYGSVAENIWTWWFIKPAKKRALKLGYDLQSLDQELASLSPIPHAPRLKGKKILLYLAQKDKIIRYDQSIQFKQALDNAGAEHIFIENKRHGHNLSAMSNFRNYKVWLDFLNQ